MTHTHDWRTRGYETDTPTRLCLCGARERLPSSDDDERTHRHDQVIVSDDADCPLCGLVERSEG